MATLGITPLLALLDSLTVQAQLFRAAVGDDSDDADSIAEGAANNIQTLLDAVDTDLDLGGLITEAQRRAAAVTATSLYRTLQGERMQVALDAHYGGVGSVNAFLATSNARVHPDLRLIGIQVDAPNAFPPEAVTLGSFTVSGAGAGTFTAASSVDTSTYGPANVVVMPTRTVGASTIVATLTLRTAGGQTATQVVTIPAGTLANAVIDVGTHGTDMYVACTNVTITGGTAADAFSVLTEVERALTL